jgi:hypothetical protein
MFETLKRMIHTPVQAVAEHLKARGWEYKEYNFLRDDHYLVVKGDYFTCQISYGQPETNIIMYGINLITESDTENIVLDIHDPNFFDELDDKLRWMEDWAARG